MHVNIILHTEDLIRSKTSDVQHFSKIEINWDFVLLLFRNIKPR